MLYVFNIFHTVFHNNKVRKMDFSTFFPQTNPHKFLSVKCFTLQNIINSSFSLYYHTSLPLSTPGRSPAAAALRRATLLINVDLPTFGIPSTMTRIGRPTCPLAAYASILSCSAVRTAPAKPLTPLPLRLSVSSTVMPCR